MQVQIDIDNDVWNEYVKLGIKKREIKRVTEEALKKHLSKMKNYQKLLDLERKVEWEGNLDELRKA